MDITLFAPKDALRNQDLLANARWQQTTYYRLTSQDELWEFADFLTLSKQVCTSAEEAIIYLLQRLVLEEEQWNEDTRAALDIADFEKVVYVNGYLSSRKSGPLTTAEFWTSFSEIRDGILQTAHASISKNGVAIPAEPLLQQGEIVSVACFADYWNSRQYFIETASCWVFFTWATSA
jgi:hypothetical protein